MGWKVAIYTYPQSIKVGYRWIQAVFSKVVTIFPAKIKEVFLLYQYPAGLSIAF
jgi:hypothetical protein